MTGLNKQETTIAKHKYQYNRELSTQFLKIIAKSTGHCPQWHPGHGGREHPNANFLLSMLDPFGIKLLNYTIRKYLMSETSNICSKNASVMPRPRRGRTSDFISI
jgi:hypothetical protein